VTARLKYHAIDHNIRVMNLLRNEDNAKYRTLMKNTLEFDPEILKRYAIS